MKILYRTWFSPMGNPGIIGLVVVENEITRERKAYIGQASGYDQVADEEYISKTGAKFTKAILAELTKQLEDRNCADESGR